MAFTLPRLSDAGFLKQAEPDSPDFDIIVAGSRRTGVHSGCVVTAQGTPNMTLSVSPGVYEIDGVYTTYAGGSVTLTSDAANAKRVLITATLAGAISAVNGTAAASPFLPAIPASRVVLASVEVPATATAIGSTNIVDKRVLLRLRTTTRGDIIRRGVAGEERLAVGTKGSVLMSDGVDPVYAEYNPYTYGPAVNLFGVNADFEAGSPTIINQGAPPTSQRTSTYAYQGRWSYYVVSAATAGSGVVIESPTLSLATGVTRYIAIGARVWANYQQNMWGRLLYTDTTQIDAVGINSNPLPFLSGWTNMRGTITTDSTKTPSKFQFYCWNAAAISAAIFIDNVFAYEV